MENGGNPKHRGGYIFLMLFSLAAMALGCFASFTVFIKGHEEVLVPDVTGKKLEDALCLMQEKELYAKLTLRHGTAKDKGLVLEQTPPAGSIRKGYSRVSLVVSQGPLVDKIGDYRGMMLDEVRLQVAAQFAGLAQPLIIIGQPIYKEDDSIAGTVLEQEPEALTPISDVTSVRLVVSRGNGLGTISPPDMKGFSMEAVLNTVSSLPLIFDYTSRPPKEGEVIATVVDMENANQSIEQWSHVAITLNLPAQSEDGKKYGIFEAETQVYPKPVKMRLAAIEMTEEEAAQNDALDEIGLYADADENAEDNITEITIASFMHIGGHITVPYCISSPAVLLLYAEDTPIKRMEIRE